MKKFCYVIGFFVCSFCFVSNVSIAQESPDGYNKNSVYPVNDAYKMYTKQVWRRVDMEEKRNLPFLPMPGCGEQMSRCSLVMLDLYLNVSWISRRLRTSTSLFWTHSAATLSPFICSQKKRYRPTGGIWARMEYWRIQSFSRCETRCTSTRN